MYKPKHCSPKKKSKGRSCLNNSLLKKIVNILNKNYKCNLDTGKSQNNIYNNICKKIKEISDCENEACWSSLDVIKKGLSDNDYRNFVNSFRPFMPEKWKENPGTWLNTNDIDNVLNQYKEKYDFFEYPGAIPIDFDKKTDSGSCMVNDICKIDVESLLNNKKKCMGVVFNTDPHNASGQHWFSIYIDLVGKNMKNKPTIYYFDSVAEDPQQEIVEFVQKLQGQFKDMGKELDVVYNDIKHQYENTECGVYSIHFITSMLKGMQFRNYVNNINSDRQMREMRNLFFVKV